MSSQQSILVEKHDRIAILARNFRAEFGQSHDGNSKMNKHRVTPAKELFGGVQDSVFGAPEAGADN